MLTIKKVSVLAILALVLTDTASAQILPNQIVAGIVRNQMIQRECNDRAFFAWTIADSRDRGAPLEGVLRAIGQSGHAGPNTQAWALDYATAIYRDPVLRNIPAAGIKASAYRACVAYQTGEGK